jgi:hypothetical protein
VPPSLGRLINPSDRTFWNTYIYALSQRHRLAI